MASESDVREARVIALLRTAIAFVAALGALVIALSYLDVTITDLDYRDHVERAGSDELTVVVLAALLPAGWAYRRPRWPQLVVWIMWITSWLMLGAIAAVNREPYEWARPEWVRPLISLSLAAVAFVVIIVMPLIRRTHKSPPLPRTPNLPPARLVR